MGGRAASAHREITMRTKSETQESCADEIEDAEMAVSGRQGLSWNGGGETAFGLSLQKAVIVQRRARPVNVCQVQT